MSQDATNPVDVHSSGAVIEQMVTDKRPTLQKLPKTVESAAIAKVIHPPTAVPNFNGLPTQDARNCVNIEFRNLFTLSQPYTESTAVTAPHAGTVTLPLGYWFTTGSQYPIIPFAFDTPNNQMQQDIANSYNWANINYNFNTFPNDGQVFRHDYKSTTMMPNMTMFNDTGVIVVSQFKPNIVRGQSYTVFDQLDHSYKVAFCREIIKRGKMPKELYDADSVVKFREFKLTNMYKMLIELDRTFTDSMPMYPPDALSQIVIMGDLGNTFFPTQSQILQQSSRSYTGMAREGAFVVQKHTTAEPQWYGCGQTNSLAPTNGLHLCYYAGIDNSGQSHVIQLVVCPNPTSASPTINPMIDTAWTDMTWATVSVTGLGTQNGLVETVNNQANIYFKVYDGLCIQPSFKSSWALSSRPGPKPDFAVMEKILLATYDLPDALAAKYNAGGIGSMLASGLKGFATDLVGGLFNKPAPAPIPYTPPAAITQRESQLEKQVAELTKAVSELLAGNKGAAAADVVKSAIAAPRFRAPRSKSAGARPSRSRSVAFTPSTKRTPSKKNTPRNRTPKSRGRAPRSSAGPFPEYLNA